MRATRPATCRIEQTVLVATFFLLFPGFFYYHTLLGTGTTGAFLGGYYSPVSLALFLPVLAVYLRQVRRDPRHLDQVDLHYVLFMAYFTAVIAINAAAGANQQIVAHHLQAIVFMTQVYVIFKFADWANPRVRLLGLASLAAMSAIAVAFSVDGVFYLGALGTAKDADSLATYQGFSRSYLFTFLVVVAHVRAMPLRLLLHAAGAATLFLNTARSEFVALLFAAPIIEFYYARHKMVFILAVVGAAAVASLYVDQVLHALPDNRILELLDLSQSSSANKRHHLTLYALQTLAAHPLLGEYASYQPGYYSHNLLSAWVDLGLFGLVYLGALVLVPVVPPFLREYFAGRRCGSFMLAFGLACVTILLLLTSHYFTDMLIAAELGACSQYMFERKYGKDRAPDFRPSAPRRPDLPQTMPYFGRTRP